MNPFVPPPPVGDLNEPQRQAVQHRDGALLVLAGPGSGKTRVITRRAAALVHAGVPPRNVLAITFTNKAATEMRQRIEALGVARGMWVCTFHALGVRLLREYGELAGVRAGFTVYDESDRLRTIKDAMAACSVSPDHLRPDRAQSVISNAKNELLSPDEFRGRSDHFDARMIANVYEAYEGLLTKQNAVDFDDLLLRVALLLRRNEDVRERLNIRFRYVLVDEYQDTNHAQYLIARYLAEQHGNLCVTGDPDQSIYSWRGADIRNILEFERDFPDAVTIRLEQNYRSTPPILAAASAVIANNSRRKHKELWTENAGDEPVRVWEFSEGRDEAERIGDALLALRDDGIDWCDIAIMYRTNALSRGMEEALRHRGIPYRIARGVEFYNRKEIRDVLGYLRIVANPDDDVALLRILNTPARGIGKTTIERVRAFAARHNLPMLAALRAADEIDGLRTAAKKIRAFLKLIDKLRDVASGGPVADAVAAALTETGLEAEYAREHESGGEDRLANVQELVTAAARYEAEADEPSLVDFLARVSLTSDQDQVDSAAGCVTLMTLHAAKGLEFPVVFIVGLEQGMLPHERSLRGDGDLEEERRLLFVGITRAMRRLYLTHAAQRLIRGQLTPLASSQFLRELPEGAVQFEAFLRPLDYGNLRNLLPEEPGGYVPTHDQLPPDEFDRRWRERTRKVRARPSEFGEPVFSPDDPASYAAMGVGKASRFADWAPGTLVQHERYGVGRVVWIVPNPGQTRAAIHFTVHGEKTFVLENAPISRLER